VGPQQLDPLDAEARLGRELDDILLRGQLPAGEDLLP
jgi:hypothetical protein